MLFNCVSLGPVSPSSPGPKIVDMEDKDSAAFQVLKINTFICKLKTHQMALIQVFVCKRGSGSRMIKA